MANKPTTIRLPGDVLEQLRLIADLEGATVTDLVCEGIDKVIKQRHAEGALRERLQLRIAHDQAILDRLT